MIKKIFITNATGGSGKDTFAELVNKYIPTYKYSIITLPKRAGKLLGWDGVSKTEKDRRFLSDIMDIATEYNDSPFRDMMSSAIDFVNNEICGNVLFIDVRSPKDIKRTKEALRAETILIRNSKVSPIYSNHADANVENYDYDYIIENDGTLEQLEAVAKIFVKDIIIENNIPKDYKKPFILTCSNY